MKKIASFTINHNTLMPGVYISRIDGDITTDDKAEHTAVSSESGYAHN